MPLSFDCLPICSRSRLPGHGRRPAGQPQREHSPFYCCTAAVAGAEIVGAAVAVVEPAFAPVAAGAVAAAAVVVVGAAASAGCASPAAASMASRFEG